VKAHRMALIGAGATGSVLAAALLSKYPETVIVGRKPETGDVLGSKGLRISGALTYQVAVKNYITCIAALEHFHPDLIFLATKTFHLERILEDLGAVYRPGLKIISTQNGLGTEDLIARKFGSGAVFRMSLNYGASLKGPGEAETAFFNRPNHLGALVPENHDLGVHIAALLTDCGLDTQCVDDIKLYVWKKMIMKCTMASICAVTNKTIVARAMGYDFGEDFLKQALGYLEKVGVHRDSMCFDIDNKAPTEIDFLGAKIVGYARQKGIETPFYVAMTNMVKAIESNYLQRTEDR